MLPDGSYDALVVDAHDGGADGVVHLELTLLDGERKGEIVRVTAGGIDRDPLDLLEAHEAGERDLVALGDAGEHRLFERLQHGCSRGLVGTSRGGNLVNEFGFGDVGHSQPPGL